MNARSMPNDARGRGREEMFNSPSTPTSSTSTREPRSEVDGWPTLTTVRAMLRQLDADQERSGYWRSRWAEDHSDQAIEAWLRSLLDWLEGSPQPLNSEPALGPVEGRSVAEIRADLAVEKPSMRDLFEGNMAGENPTAEWRSARARLLADVPSLLAEVEAAHRFERSVAVEVAALVESLERVTEERDAFRAERNIAVNAAASKIPGFNVETIAVQVGQREAADRRARELTAEVRSLRGVVQAIREQADYWLGSPLPITEGQAGAQVHRALAAAADAPQPPTCKHDETKAHQATDSLGVYANCPGPVSHE